MKMSIQVFICLLLLSACSFGKHPRYHRGSSYNNSEQTGIPPGGGASNGADPVSAPGQNQVWKRYRAFEGGLLTGLELNKQTVCQELSKYSCVDQVHLAVLGGNDPITQGIYDPANSPSVITPVAVDRVVYAACSKRLELDRLAGTAAIVFKFFPLTGAMPTADKLDQQTTDLYRRMLARDPEPKELEIVRSFVTQTDAPDKLALDLCFAIGTNVENILL